MRMPVHRYANEISVCFKVDENMSRGSADSFTVLTDVRGSKLRSSTQAKETCRDLAATFMISLSAFYTPLAKVRPAMNCAR